ncbi:hypothetical protein V6N13_059690 [Hibiscus sabdariffa]|uniref:Uncharacterized protein n=1 Tax=Hibiscus sabdariffa TaxID=183260 RepID=A0ABR2GCF0_9ROSI
MMSELGIASKRGEISELVKVNVGDHDDVLRQNMRHELDRSVKTQVAESQDKGPSSQQLNPNTKPAEGIEDY